MYLNSTSWLQAISLYEYMCVYLKGTQHTSLVASWCWGAQTQTTTLDPSTIWKPKRKASGRSSWRGKNIISINFTEQFSAILHLFYITVFANTPRYPISVYTRYLVTIRFEFWAEPQIISREVINLFPVSFKRIADPKNQSHTHLMSFHICMTFFLLLGTQEVNFEDDCTSCHFLKKLW